MNAVDAAGPPERTARSRRRLRVCLVSEEQEGWGGIGTYTAVLARGLRDLGHTVHLILRNWEDDRSEQLDGIAVHRLTVPEPSWRRGTVRAVEHLYGAREALLWSRRAASRVSAIAREQGLDVVEVPEHRGSGAALGVRRARGLPASTSRIARERPVPLVVRLHTPAFLTERANEQHDDWLDRRAVEWLERLAVRRADVLTAPSAAVAEAVQARWRLSASRVAVVPNPVDDDLFSPAPYDLLHPEPHDLPGPARHDRPGPARHDLPGPARHDLPGPARHDLPGPARHDLPSPRQASADRPPTILCVGRLERVKGVDVLVEALPRLLARHPDVKVVLVGEDDAHGHREGSMAAYLHRRACELGVPDGALEIRGAVDRRELPALLRQAAVCVVPSRWENLPYACIEAMACGRPVIASRVGGLSEAIDDGVDGLLVPPADPHALAAAIARVLQDSALAERLRRAARATVERRFARHAVAASIARVYRDASRN